MGREGGISGMGARYDEFSTAEKEGGGGGEKRVDGR